jgi:hypothetical protein
MLRHPHRTWCRGSAGTRAPPPQCPSAPSTGAWTDQIYVIILPPHSQQNRSVWVMERTWRIILNAKKNKKTKKMNHLPQPHHAPGQGLGRNSWVQLGRPLQRGMHFVNLAVQKYAQPRCSIRRDVARWGEHARCAGGVSDASE